MDRKIKERLMKSITLFCGIILFVSHLPVVGQNSIPDLIIQYHADQELLERFYTVQGAAETIDRMQRLIADYQTELEAFNYDQLTLDEKVDYQLFLRSLKEDDRRQRELRSDLKAAGKLFPFSEKIYSIIVAKRRGKQPDAAETAAQMTSIEQEISALSQKVQEGPNIDASMVRPALGYLSDLKKALAEVHRFYYDYDPDYSWWTKKPYEELVNALNRYAELLDEKKEVQSNQKKDESGIVGVPIGDDEIRKQLRHEMIPYTPDELVQIAEKEFAWCDREMLKASRALGYGDNWHQALEFVKEKYVEPGKQPEVINRLYEESVEFIKERDLLTVPPLAEETWRMSMMSPERQRVSPFFLGGDQIIISYPTSTMTHEEKLMSMRGNNPHFSRATVQHELIPGHGLQAFMGRRYKTYRRFSTPFWGEGWALYWERLLWDLGFPETPEDKIGMLFWRMHRCARIIFSLKYHQGEWTPQQCIDFLVERVGHERANAEGEVRRSFTGGYGPLYQLAYMIGGLQFEALKKEMVDGGQMTYREFHDAILRENRMPVEMARALITKQAPPRNFETNWRFYQIE
jgi:uncharacterized protein (DUF885 family)